MISSPRLLCTIVFLLTSLITFSVEPPRASLAATTSQTIGLTEVSVSYSRPNANERDIFGALVPFDEVWRTGANEATVIEFSTEATIGGNQIAAGRYSLFTIPGKQTWTVIINETADQFGAFSYDASHDLFRFSAPARRVSDHQETFEIGFANVGDNRADLELRWGNLVTSIPISVTEETNHQQMLTAIRRDIIDGEAPTWGNYGEAARYYVARDIDLPQAIEWFEKCNELNPDAWWMFVEKARALALAGRKDAAIAAVETAIQGAVDTGQTDGENWARSVLAEINNS